MSHWENNGKSNEWYTPKYIFDALDVSFDMDVASPKKLDLISTPTKKFINADSLNTEWLGFIWMNPPFGGRNSICNWLNKFTTHNNGIALTPDRTSCDWWQKMANESDAVLFVHGKIKFINENGDVGKSPSNGTTLFACGDAGIFALKNAESNGLGTLFYNKKIDPQWH